MYVILSLAKRRLVMQNYPCGYIRKKSGVELWVYSPNLLGNAHNK